ncbi:MAG: glycosyltransferase, partial [Ardenticatenales bacterium]
TPATMFFTWQNLNRRYPLPFRAFERYAYRTAAGAVAGSATAAAVLRAKGFDAAKPIWTIPQFGVDEQIYHPPAATGFEHAATGVEPAVTAVTAVDEPPRDTRPGRLAVAYAGRLIEAKGVADLIAAVAALAALADDRPGITLEILGSGPDAPRLARLAAAAGLADRVAFTPWLPSAAMPAFYRRIDALVLPSRSTPTWIEQFGRVLTEAMACGAVVVGSDSGEIPHVIGDAGLVFPEGDVDALAAALRRLADDVPHRLALAAAGRRRVLERFTMRAVADATVAAWRDVLGAAPPSASGATAVHREQRQH